MASIRSNVDENPATQSGTTKDGDPQITRSYQWNFTSHSNWQTMQQLYYQYYYTMYYLHYMYSWPFFSHQSQTNHQQWLYEQNYLANTVSTQQTSVQHRSAVRAEQQQVDQNRNVFTTITGQPPALHQAQQVQRVGCEARVASIQKRVFAEIIDFVFMYFTKYIVFSIFYNNFEYFTQLQYSLIVDENTSITDLEQLLIQALVYRIMVFLYEVFFLTGGLYGSTGGATPGKFLMGLTVIAGDHIETLEFAPGSENRIRILPGGTLGLWRSCCRALVKNFSMTFLFPVFLTILFFPHNRTIYDVIAGSVVVDDGRRRNQQQP